MWQLHILFTAQIPVISGSQRSPTPPRYKCAVLPIFLKDKYIWYATHPSLPLNSSPKLPDTPLSPLLLTPTDPSQISSPTCTIIHTIRSNTTTKPHLSAHKELSCFHPQGSKFQFCLCHTEAFNYSEFICNVGSLLLATKETLKKKTIFSRLRANVLVHISNIHQCSVEQLASPILATKLLHTFLGTINSNIHQYVQTKPHCFFPNNPLIHISSNPTLERQS